MVVSNEKINLDETELTEAKVLLASANTLGNGTIDSLADIIYIKPDSFTKDKTRVIAAEIDRLNHQARQNGHVYLLIGFGRWGSSDPWLGIPVDWSNISHARVIVEATTPEMNIELSQGSHFFHNITSLQIPYICVTHTGRYKIDWSWLETQKIVAETDFVRHVKCERTLLIKVDGRSRRGVIKR